MSDQVPEGWHWSTFGDVVSTLKSGLSRRIVAQDIGVPVLISGNIQDNRLDTSELKYWYLDDPQGADTKRYFLKDGDLLLCFINSLSQIGKVCVYKDIGRPVIYTTNLFRVVINDEHEPRFMFNLMTNKPFQDEIKLITKPAVNQASFTKSDLEQIRVLLPPLPEQKKIAAILTSVDDVIEKTQAQIDKLKDLKAGMMQELLTRGVGVDGKPHTEFKSLPKWHTGRIADINEIPVSWELVTLSEVAKLESGHTPSRDNSSYWGGEYQWVSLHDTKQLNVAEITKTKFSITQTGLDNSSARLLPKGTVFFSRTASVGNCVIAGVDMATSQDFANYICGEKLHNKYLYHMFSWMQHVWEQLSEGSTHKTIYMPVFKKLQILLPPMSEQILISQAADSVDKKLAAVECKLEAFNRMKKALMQDLLTGNVRVKVDS